MQDKIKSVTSNTVSQVTIVGRAAYGVLVVIVPAAISAYLIDKFNDKVVVGVAVVLGLYALAHLSQMSYRAAAASATKKKSK